MCKINVLNIVQALVIESIIMNSPNYISIFIKK